MDKIDLSLVPMDDMVEEIKKRFDTLIILTRKQINEDNDDIHYHFKDKIGGLGLMRIADEGIKNDYREKETGTFDN